MAKKDPVVRMVFADSKGNIYDHPDLLMLTRRGQEWMTPRFSDLMELPPESELMLLPKRQAVGLNPTTGDVETESGQTAVAAFIAPGNTVWAHPAYKTEEGAPLLPFFAYAALGFANDHFYVAAKTVDTDCRQQFAHIAKASIAREANALRRTYANNRLLMHIMNNCVARYDCPAARNFALGRFEAPLPTSTTCNARCLGCISQQDKDSPFPITPQCRLTFIPRVDEIVQMMEIHSKRAHNPIYSFGQGCEGDPLTNWELITDSIAHFRAKKGPGTININTNGSISKAIVPLATAGLTSIRVSINSAQPALYTTYYRPKGYRFDDVVETIRLARANNLFVSLNLLFFPGITDTEEELEALATLVGCGVSMIQWRNLNIDPEWYNTTMRQSHSFQTFGMGLMLFMKRLLDRCPWLRYGYFNPYLGEKTIPQAPMPRL